MSQIAKKLSEGELSIIDLEVSNEELTAKISDGRTISIPTKWFPILEKASLDQLKNFEISPGGYGIHWPLLDEDISINAFISP